MGESSRSSNVAVAATDAAADNKIRLTPLQPCQAPPALSQELDRVLSWTAPPRLTPTRIPPEFDQLFAGGDMSSMFSMLEHDDLIKEIEASLPDNLQDNPEENASVGSESDPSGDNMEEEEEEVQQKSPPKKAVLPPPQKAEAIVVSPILLVRSRPPRVLRQRSEPRL
ncbi:hypothetical protein BBJ28_00013397 [Nothophytophthora sp. Chile5]|nr:hypothetical protein BBJ28_00013397 [Nothophytophthora sp. Chile5]